MPRKIVSKSEALFLKDVGRNLRAIRRRQGLTQKQFAKMLNLSRDGYANYELGKREMGIFTVRDIRQKMKVDPLTSDPICSWQEPPLLCRKDAAICVPLWVRWLQSQRAKIVAARKTFNLEMFTPFRRRLHYVREIVFISSTITAWLRLEFLKFGWSKMDIATTQIDWSLLISYPIAVILLPFQMWYLAHFLHWMCLTSDSR